MDIRKEMKVERVKEEKGKVIVETTGARYVIDKLGKCGKISCYQMLNKERLITTIDFNYPFSNLSIERKDDSTVVLHQPVGGCEYLRLQINSDSLLDIYHLNFFHATGVYPAEARLNFQGNFLADYSAEKDGNILLIDKIGGIGIYPYQGLRNIEWSNFTDKEWKINYTLYGYCRVFISIFPPRRFNYTQSFEDRIAHHGSIGNWDPPPPPYPTDEMIEELRKYANILVLHEMLWQGKYTRKGKSIKTLKELYLDYCWCCDDYVPVNEKELIRVVKKAHSLKMKVIPYMSPYYSMAKGKDFLERIDNAIKKYEFDGVYFDGVSPDILYSYQMIRDARALLKDKILYVHCTADTLMSRDIYCPFIDTYADYILRAEGTTSIKEGQTKLNDKYLRYVISGYNISNSIGYLCYYDLPVDFIRKIIDKVLAVNARFYLGSPETEREKLLKKEYFPKLQIRKDEQWKKKE